MKYLRMIFAVIALASAASSLPAADAKPSIVPSGSWGGDHVAMTVTADSVELEFDCARGYIDKPLVIDSHGSFKMQGTYRRERPAAAQADSEDGTPVVYAGSIKGDVMRLEVQIPGQENISFQLVRGEEGRITKCA